MLYNSFRNVDKITRGDIFHQSNRIEQERIVMTWVLYACMAMIGFVLFLITVPLFAKMGYRGDVVLLWWYLGTSIGIAIWRLMMYSGKDVLMFDGAMISVLILGIVIGAFANIGLGYSLNLAPNPGFPLAIVNLNAGGVLLGALLLSKYFPEHYPASVITTQQGIGMLLALLGISLIAIK